jgi:hypothetical protein
MPIARRVEMSLLPRRYGVCRLDADGAIPEWAMHGEFWTVTRTTDELSITCAEDRVPPGVRAERGFRLLKLAGPIDMAQTGVIAAIAGPLAEAGISLVPIATFDTDYILVRHDTIDRAIGVLRAAGHTVREA